MKWTLVLVLLVAGFWVRWERGRQMGVVLPDTIRFIEQAQAMPADPVAAVRNEVYHPLHSLAILGTRELLVRMKLAGAGPDDKGEGAVEKERMAWADAAVIDGTICGTVMALLIFLLGRQLGAGYWEALVGMVMWMVGQRTSAYGADGMSDMMALCFFTGSLLFAMRGMRFGGPGGRGRGTNLFFTASGVLAGLAYLTRPEGLAAPLTVTATVVIWWVVARRRQARAASGTQRRESRRFKLIPHRPPPGWKAVSGLAWMWVAVLALGLPYAIAIGGLTQKKHLMTASAAGHGHAEVQGMPNARAWARGEGVARAGMGDAAAGFVTWVWEEVVRTFGYAPMGVLLVPVLWKRQWWGRARLRLLVIVWTAVWYAVMFWLLIHSGYLNGRHTLPLVALGYGLVGIALRAWEVPMRRWMGYWGRWPGITGRIWRWPHWPRVCMAGVFAFMLAVTLPMLRQPVWGEVIGEREAAQWVRENITEDVTICDKQQVVGFYSWHPFAHWIGEPAKAEIAELERIKDGLRRQSGREPVVMIGRLYEEGRGVTYAIGEYRAVAEFGRGERRGDLYVLYALPGEKVMRDGGQTRFLAESAAGAKEKAPESGPFKKAMN